ncbi:MAG: hypothetical protein M1838_002707 [Thelocarpon superellum]|nr:MAG: hypothetical protein M1838_002707 [Thelocarpon superellum]
MSHPHDGSHRISTFGRRPIQANPLLQRTKDTREQRRNLFLKKIRDSGEERRWQARGPDEVMRTVFLAERKRWEEMQARLAAHVVETELDDETNMQMTADDVRGTFSIEQQIPDDGPATEDTSTFPSGKRDLRDRQSTSQYGSDDDEYNDLFLQMIDHSPAGLGELGERNEEGMDMSRG